MSFERHRQRDRLGGPDRERCASTGSAIDDGEEAEREVVAHPGAVAIVAHDGERLYLVRQPREAVGEQALLELPAGKLDEEGEEPARDRQARARRGDRQGRARPGST